MGFVDILTGSPVVGKRNRDLAVLRAVGSLNDENVPAYGLVIMQRVAEQTGWSIPQGAIYNRLRRLESEGFLESEWFKVFISTEEGERTRICYRLTPGSLRSFEEQFSGIPFEAGGLAPVSAFEA